MLFLYNHAIKELFQIIFYVILATNNSLHAYLEKNIKGCAVSIISSKQALKTES